MTIMQPAIHPRDMQRSRKLLLYSVQLGVSLALTGALLEIILRLFPAAIAPSLLLNCDPSVREEIAQRLHLRRKSQTRVVPRDDGGPPLLFMAPPIVGTEVLDQNGFPHPRRDAYDRPRIDIISIGDSFTAATAVDPSDTWTSQLGVLSGRSVYNLGMGGVGPYEYVQILKAYGLQKAPWIVVMNIYGGNDLRDSRHYAEYRQSRAGLRQASLPETATESGHSIPLLASLEETPIGRHSYAFNALLAVARDIRYARARHSTKEVEQDFHYQLLLPGGAVRFNPNNWDSDEARYAKLLQKRQIDLDLFKGALTEFARLARQHHFLPVVSYTPPSYVAYAGRVTFDDPTLTSVMPWFDQQQRSYLNREATTLGYLFVDLTPALQRAAGTSDPRHLLYYPTNLHLTKEGHAVVARALLQTLSRQDEWKKMGPSTRYDVTSAQGRSGWRTPRTMASEGPLRPRGGGGAGGGRGL